MGTCWESADIVQRYSTDILWQQGSNKLERHITKYNGQKSLPSHETPSSELRVYPVVHEQAKEPGELTHVWSQLPSNKHSSMSAHDLPSPV